jgi:diguanylate cyclase (GGDEF)-like protein
MAGDSVSVSVPVFGLIVMTFGLLLVLGWVMHRRVLGGMTAQARHDALTKLLNRRGWDEELPREIARARRSALPLCVVLVDLDHFKHFNDLHGHQAGDALLAAAARATETCVREVDTVARHGGEEFALLLPDCEPDAAELVLDRLRTLFPTAVTFSAGLAQWDGSESAGALMARVDRALYEAKLAGRDRTVRAGSATLVTELARTPEAPRRARQAVEPLRGQLGDTDFLDVQLLISELVTNAVKYGGEGPVRVETTVTPALVRCEVTDQGSGFVAPPADELEELTANGHWGLEVVGQVADRWGTREGSTIVWFELHR